MEDLHAKLEWFERDILPHSPVLRSRLRKLKGAGEDLDDLVSEVLTRAYANSRWQQVSNGRAYLFTIARNLLVDSARRQKVVAFDSIVEFEALQSSYDFSAHLCARDQLRKLQPVLDGLPPQPRRVFVARRLHEKSLAQIAEEMGLSVSTVEKHLGVALAAFMRALAQQEQEVISVGKQPDSAASTARGGGNPPSARVGERGQRG
ncbi:RNA polymerase sigma factor [Novosphingobium rosa]|uniref:RNA polymerase sigma factor n=1 Tax=Novosphingobium rosa TaxID=76978 RepID=UPI0008359CB0|nr:sigma-70 family RNA polymerase sigma factor [Novosphingobium rosa]